MIVASSQSRITYMEKEIERGGPEKSDKVISDISASMRDVSSVTHVASMRRWGSNRRSNRRKSQYNNQPAQPHPVIFVEDMKNDY